MDVPSKERTRAMKISVTLTIDMTPEDVDAWCVEYGVERSEVRGDVKGYVINSVQSQLFGVAGIEGVTGR